mmetsp:Transcript_4419/g.6625  ORF Transcript_4419/g.6625 Transcript_4419/m.6625 type:complete len:215 (+) Transcript_4419:1079-1723(+)
MVGRLVILPQQRVRLQLLLIQPSTRMIHSILNLQSLIFPKILHRWLFMWKCQILHQPISWLFMKVVLNRLEEGQIIQHKHCHHQLFPSIQFLLSFILNNHLMSLKDLQQFIAVLSATKDVPIMVFVYLLVCVNVMLVFLVMLVKIIHAPNMVVVAMERVLLIKTINVYVDQGGLVLHALQPIVVVQHCMNKQQPQYLTIQKAHCMLQIQIVSFK